MPIPQRKSREQEQDFIGRCSSKLIGEEGYEREQAVAICYQQLSINLTADKQWRKDFLAFKPESTCLKHYTHKPSEEYRKG
jgi:hypothetical protein